MRHQRKLIVPLLKLWLQGVSDRKTAKQYMDAMMIYHLGNLAALLLERGGNGRWTPEEVDADCEDVLRLMSHLKIIKEDFNAIHQTEIAKAVYEEAPADGYWFPEVCAGQEVLKDALLGRWKSSDGTQSCEVRARFAGRVLYETTALGVRRNDPLIAYGTA